MRKPWTERILGALTYLEREPEETGLPLPVDLFESPRRGLAVTNSDQLPPMTQDQTVSDVYFSITLERRKIKKVIFRNVTFPKNMKKLTFSGCRFEACRFVGTHLEEVEFHRCDFSDSNLWKARFTDVYLDPQRIKFGGRYRREAANVGISVYQSLVANFALTRQQTFLRHADIQFHRWQRYQLTRKFRDDEDDLKPEKPIRSWIANYLADHTLGYGYSPFRIMITTSALFFSTASLNHFLISERLLINGERVTNPSFADSIFYTFSMLTVLGFSFITPGDEWAKLTTVFEVLCAIGWLGILTSVFVKRYVP